MHWVRAVSVFPKQIHFSFTFPQRQFILEEYNQGLLSRGNVPEWHPSLKRERRAEVVVHALGGLRSHQDQASSGCGQGVAGLVLDIHSTGRLQLAASWKKYCLFLGIFFFFLAWNVIVYQFHTQMSSKGRLLATETTLHFQRPCICEHQGGGTEKWEKACVFTCPGPYDTHWVLTVSHVHDMWEDCSIFSGWAGKCLSDLINITRWRELLWKETPSEMDFKWEGRKQEMPCAKCISNRKGRLAYKWQENPT